MKLEVKNLVKSFDQTEILHGISFHLESGKALGLLGRNGAGKTTTIRILMNVFNANSGEVLMDGKPFVPENYHIGYMPEERGMYPKKKVLDQLIYFAQLRGFSKAEGKKSALELLEKLQISDYAKRKMETLSKGNQQKVQLAETLICSPDIIILDEPFSGLDPVNSQLLKDLIMEEISKGKLVIFSSHQMGYVEEFCEDIVIINKGNIVLSGNLNEIQKHYGNHKGILSANNYTVDKLADICREQLKDLIEIDEIKKDVLVFKMKDTKSAIMRKLAETDIDISEFGDYKPSLTDIFVKEAGE